MGCSDGKCYVVKFLNNPQHVRVLANELFASRLARKVGLPVPLGEIIQVDDWLIEHNQDLRIQLAHGSVPCQPGMQFGSPYAVDPIEGQVFDLLPTENLSAICNLATFAGILAFDKWTGNSDGRQAAFWRRKRERKYNTLFIDQGYCFNGGEWTFPDDPLKGVFSRNEVYEDIRIWDSFEPWLSSIESMREETVWGLASELPPSGWVAIATV